MEMAKTRYRPERIIREKKLKNCNEKHLIWCDVPFNPTISQWYKSDRHCPKCNLIGGLMYRVLEDDTGKETEEEKCTFCQKQWMEDPDKFYDFTNYDLFRISVLELSRKSLTIYKINRDKSIKNPKYKIKAVANKNKTHCKKGHEFTVENTYINPSGDRICRKCMKINTMKLRIKKRMKNDSGQIRTIEEKITKTRC